MNADRVIFDGKRPSRRWAISTESSLARAMIACCAAVRSRAIAASASPWSFAISCDDCWCVFSYANWADFGAAPSSRSRSAPISARPLSAPARAPIASWRAAAASASSLFVSSCRLATISTTGRKKNRARIQMRTRTLTVWSASVHQSMCMGSVDEGVGEQHQQRDRQTVDRHGLDHRQADEQRPGYGARGLRLAGDSVHRGSDRSSFAKRRTNSAKRYRHRSSEDADDVDLVHNRSLSLLSPEGPRFPAL